MGGFCKKKEIEPVIMEEMMAALKAGQSMNSVCERYNVSRNWLRNHRTDTLEKPALADVMGRALSKAEIGFHWTKSAENLVLTRVSVGTLPDIHSCNRMEPNATQVRMHCDEDPVFAARYERALTSTADTLVTSAVQIIQQEPERIGGAEGRIDPSFVTWNRLKVETMLKVATYINPRRYGARLDITTISANKVDQNGEIDPTLYTDEELQTLARLLARRTPEQLQIDNPSQTSVS